MAQFPSDVTDKAKNKKKEKKKTRKKEKEFVAFVPDRSLLS
jgi:hypothetical protein